MGRIVLVVVLFLMLMPRVQADPEATPYPFPSPATQAEDYQAPRQAPKPLPPPTLVPSPSPSMSHTPMDVTLRQAIDDALADNPSLKATEVQEHEAYYAWRGSLALPPANFNLNYTAGPNTTPTNNGEVQDIFVTVQQSFGPLGSIAVNSKAALQAYQLAKTATAGAKVTLVQNVKDGFYGLLSAQEQVKVAQENLNLANDIYDAAKKRYDAGAGPKMDLVNALIQQASSEQTLLTSVAAEQQASATLAPLLGRTASQPLKAAGAFELPSLHAEYDALLDIAEKTHPQIFAAVQTVQQSQTQVAVAKNAYQPTPSFFYNFDFTNTQNSALYLTGLSLSFPVDWGSIRNNVKQQEATVREKEYALKGAQLSVASSVKGSYDAFQAALANASVFESKVLHPSEELLRMTQYGYKEGALPYLQILTAEQTLRTARLQYITLLQTGHQALDALEAAVGQSLEGAQP